VRDADIIETLRAKLSVTSGRHVYGVLGTYPALERFARNLQQATTTEGEPFPEPLSVNIGILDSIPDEEFRNLVENESRRPEPTAKHVDMAFEKFIRAKLKEQPLIVLKDMELLFAYNLELAVLRTLPADERRVILLLPGRRERGQIVLYPDADTGRYTLPGQIIAENHLWELDET